MSREKIAYVFGSLILLFVYFVSFLVIFSLWRQVVGSPVIFYDGIRVIIVLSFVFAALSALWASRAGRSRFWAIFSSFEVRFTALACFFLAAYSFMVTFPTIIDRSISVYVISTVAQAGKVGISLQGIQEHFLRGYVDGTDAVQKRTNEQVITGNIVESGGLYKITNSGLFFYKLNIAIAELFNVSRKYIYATNLNRTD